MNYQLRNFIKKNIHYRVIDFIRNRDKFLRDLRYDFNSKAGKYNYKYHKIFIAGLPKSGTTRIENFFYNIPGYVARPLYGDLKTIIEQDLPCNAFKYFKDDLYSYVKTHVNPTEKNLKVLHDNNIFKIVISYRDPRDVAVSRYFHLLKYPKKSYEPYSEVNYNFLSKEEGLLHSLKVVKASAIPWIFGWLSIVNKNKDNYLIMKYEDVIENPVKKFKELTDFYEFDFEINEIERILQITDSKMKKGFNLNQTVGSISTFRKGIKGDWKNHFTEKHYEYIEKEMKEDLIKLGYY